MSKGININTLKWDIEHYKHIERYARMIDEIYQTAIKEAARIGLSISNLDKDKLFAFSSYPQTTEQINNLMSQFVRDIKYTVDKGITEEWIRAAKKNDAFVDYIFKGSGIPKEKILSYYDRNLDALKVFQKRKIRGMGLSERVWNYSKQFKREIELGLDIGLGEGTSADQLAKDLMKNLKEPDKLFTRVKNKKGTLELSKVAKNYHPGQGVYRSSYKNAMRMTRTEVNMAYRNSDHERWKKLDFVRGIEVRLSEQHPRFDICDHLQGTYPKDFQFSGWHPQCLCHAIPVLMTPEELDEFEEKKLNGESVRNFTSSQDVNDVPQGFKDWVENNMERAEGWKTQPYFVRDNFKYGRMERGLKIKTG